MIQESSLIKRLLVLLKHYLQKTITIFNYNFQADFSMQKKSPAPGFTKGVKSGSNIMHQFLLRGNLVQKKLHSCLIHRSERPWPLTSSSLSPPPSLLTVLDAYRRLFKKCWSTDVLQRGLTNPESSRKHPLPHSFHAMCSSWPRVPHQGLPGAHLGMWEGPTRWMWRKCAEDCALLRVLGVSCCS